MAKRDKRTTREQWLLDAVGALRAVFDGRDLPLPPPDRLAVACGWPSVGGLAKVRRRIGECWSSTMSRAGKFEMFISPLLDDPLAVLAVLAHEMVHATVGLECGHRAPFRRAALAIGLVGPMRATTAGDELGERLNAIAAGLGPYPHKAIDDMTDGRRRQTGRNRALTCPACGYKVWATRKWTSLWLPTCGCPARAQFVAEGISSGPDRSGGNPDGGETT